MSDENTLNSWEGVSVESSSEESPSPIFTQQPVGLTLTPDYQDLIKEEARKTAENIVQWDKASLINVFGIFASIVAFISIEIQVLKQICDFERLLGFSAFILAWLLSFIFILQYIMKSWMENDKGVIVSEIFTKRYWITFKINFSLLLAFLTIVFLFCYSYIAMWKADSEYLCKDLQIQQKFGEIKDKLENIEFEKYKKLNEKIELQQKQIDILSPKK